MSETVIKKTKKQLNRQPVSAEDLMPCTEKDLQVLNHRAEHLSRIHVEQKKLNETTTYVKFKVSENEYYGIPYQFVKEVMHNVMLTKLPRMPDHIAGIMNRRSTLITVLDLKYI